MAATYGVQIKSKLLKKYMKVFTRTLICWRFLIASFRSKYGAFKWAIYDFFFKLGCQTRAQNTRLEGFLLHAFPTRVGRAQRWSYVILQSTNAQHERKLPPNWKHRDFTGMACTKLTSRGRRGHGTLNKHRREQHLLRKNRDKIQ